MEISKPATEIFQQVLLKWVFLKHNILLMVLISTESNFKLRSYVEVLRFADPKEKTFPEAGEISALVQ